MAAQEPADTPTGPAPVAREVVELPALPASGPLYRRAVLGSVPGLLTRRPARGPVDALPPVELRVRGVTVDRTRLADYDRVCGFPLTDPLPGTFPHVLGFPLALRLITAPDFPIPLAGVVHIANRITVRRLIDAGEPMDFSAYAENLRPHRRGRQLDVVLVASVSGAEVWRGVSTYLSRERVAAAPPDQPEPPSDQPDPDSPGGRGPAATGSAVWRVGPRVGRDYARVSGDHNPIHTSRIGARLLGFPRPIAHGMWSKARCLAALASRLPSAYTVDVAFRLPVPLPSTVAFATTPEGAFALHDPRTGRPHLLGQLTPPAVG
ncbi:MaoC/PaaZ C-terminal domain-containing protein [Micromonospora sp. WMMD882]|uniref:MaoC/PaaZ C-terminal domain-containing protein n=1 Tax=Micromonospora sp. WMMD882 TaxID=3015151 RepID=UPI00248B1860|nr:MaoC/PaaZ C-terminal domain-containing protein [Micromonospora sp. WMMD882]WBB78175.1 MaoC/PaaZ C-terminal domain-containing protein [Micromonospora sp. WMMD882]